MTPRVNVVSVTQFLDGSLFTNPNSTTETLHDRPPLLLKATVNHPNGASFPITVIVNHMRSLNGMTDTSPGSNGWATDGERIRAKRLAQAVDLANFVQSRQTSDPTERIILVGDFNFFEFNDGYVDSMSTLLGAPVPDNETVVPGDGVDLVNPNLTILQDTDPLQRYSFVFDGNAQTLDHAILNAPLIANTLSQRLEHPRINADFPETDRNDAEGITRLADHDPLVAYFEVAAFLPPDLSLTKTHTGDFTIGMTGQYNLTVTNEPGVGVTTAPIVITDNLPGNLTLNSFSGMGWSCTGTGTANVSCTPSTSEPVRP
jgi:uncharacterized protein